jgi:hypothetical protein
MNQHVDIDRWQRLWQARADGPNASDLRDQVARESRRRKASFIAPVLVTVVIGAGVIARAMTSGSALEIAVAIEAWLFIAIVWTVTIRIDRHNWRPLGNTTTAFVDLSIRRCESDLQGLRAAVVLFIAQFIAIVALKQSLAPVGLLDLLTAWPVVVIGWLGFPALLVGVRWHGRRKRGELRRLLELRRQLVED